MAFDILYYNDKSLLKETFETRRKTLHDNFGEIRGQFMFAIG
jgi:DNA ligase-1